jgi:hypothetical protein
MSDRLMVGRDMPQGTGVESVIHTVSCQKSVSLAKTRVILLICGKAARMRLLWPDFPGR